ncbi:hypothetical protein DFH27DRAFT_521172 [Peziza echinospora]|nr:hypothetical protein DFH27DRAFT_521172 [Peziza echinospora]
MPVYNRRSDKSPRYLALRHARKLFSPPLEEEDDIITLRGGVAEAKKPEKLLPGWERLYSFYTPSIPAGKFSITTEQIVTVPNEGGTNYKPLKLTGTQVFTVVAPQYQLPAGVVHSKYPPNGHADLAQTLPHMVFSDPHLPWMRVGSRREEKDQAFNRVPWLALLVFTQDELQLTPATEPPWIGEAADKPKKSPAELQTATLSVGLSLDKLDGYQVVTPVRGRDAATTADFIFVKGDLLTELTREYDPDWIKEGAAQEKCSVGRYKWLAHVRNINTAGMAEAGEFDNEEGVFSIVMSHRTGPVDLKEPRPVYVHLVSIENLEELAWPLRSESRVALCSLASWSYMTLPADAFNVVDAMEHLGTTLGVLRPTEQQIADIRAMDGPEAQWLASRLSDGYTLAKHRTATGEMSAALYRGPFAPTVVQQQLKPLSTFGTDLQVLDQQTGLMDITYDVAWQAGRTLALGDQAFTAALGRLRTAIHREAVRLAQVKALQEDHAGGGYVDRDGALRGIVDSIGALSAGPATAAAPGAAARWSRDEVEPVDLAFGSHAVASRIGGCADEVMRGFAAARTDAAAAETDPTELYNEINAHTLGDWPPVMSWLLDRMYLANLPPQYFVPDPSHLPRESLRFFHIDQNWVDALIDGGLSIANQVEKGDDKLRTCIKTAINRYLETPLKADGYLPQVPTHGFLLRSELVTKFPDLIVEAPITGPAAGATRNPAPILRQQNLDSTVLMTLFDRTPGAEDFKSLILRQPPHQQSFAVGTGLDALRLSIDVKKVYTIPSGDAPEVRNSPFKLDDFHPDSPDAPYVWGQRSEIRTLKFPQYAKLVWQKVWDKMHPSKFDEPHPTAVMVGIQLNNPMYFLEILDKARPKFENLGGGGLRTLGMLSSPIAGPAPQGDRRLLLASDMFDTTSTLASLADRTLAAGDGGALPAAAPHVRNLPALTDEQLAPDDDADDDNLPSLRAPSEPAGYPVINYTCYSFGSFARENNAVAMFPDKLRQDLIFHVSATKGTIYNFGLLEVQISINIGDMKAERKNLTLQYDGPGASMLTNLRVNVIPVTGENSKLVLRLLPRSTSREGVQMKLLGDMSFVLNGVIVNEYAEGKGLEDDPDWPGRKYYRVLCNVTERYYGKGDNTRNFWIKIWKPEGDEFDRDD